MLNKLILKNWQKHSFKEIDFVNGVNVLTGASDTGKSCIRRAIEWVYGMVSLGDCIRKTGTKQTSVEVFLENNISVERIRSVSINRYIIKKDDNIQVFDSVGKTIPDEVRKVLGVFPIVVDSEEIYLNSHPQIGLPFLFDRSPAFRMKLFNKLTGNDVLDKLFSQFNKDILGIKRNLREENERAIIRGGILCKKTIEMEKIVEKHKRLKKRLESLKQKHEKYCKLLKTKELMESNFGKKKNMLEAYKGINIPEDTYMKQLMIKISDYEVYKSYKNGLEKLNIGIDRVSGHLKDYKPLRVNMGDLRGKIDRFERIGAVYEKFSQNQGLLLDIKKNMKILDKDIDYGNKELKKYKICPTCEQEIK